MPSQLLSEDKNLLSPFRQVQASNNKLGDIGAVGENDWDVPRARDCRSLIQDIDEERPRRLIGFHAHARRTIVVEENAIVE
jgi:hypothetical protein